MSKQNSSAVGAPSGTPNLSESAFSDVLVQYFKDRGFNDIDGVKQENGLLVITTGISYGYDETVGRALSTFSQALNIPLEDVERGRHAGNKVQFYNGKPYNKEVVAIRLDEHDTRRIVEAATKTPAAQEAGIATPMKRNFFPSIFTPARKNHTLRPSAPLRSRHPVADTPLSIPEEGNRVPPAERAASLEDFVKSKGINADVKVERGKTITLQTKIPSLNREEAGQFIEGVSDALGVLIDDLSLHAYEKRPGNAHGKTQVTLKDKADARNIANNLETPARNQLLSQLKTPQPRRTAPLSAPSTPLFSRQPEETPIQPVPVESLQAEPEKKPGMLQKIFGRHAGFVEKIVDKTVDVISRKLHLYSGWRGNASQQAEQSNPHYFEAYAAGSLATPDTKKLFSSRENVALDTPPPGFATPREQQPSVPADTYVSRLEERRGSGARRRLSFSEAIAEQRSQPAVMAR